jgi:Arm DNA-binding domain/Phage integrase, N-terminal SAM-like domain
MANRLTKKIVDATIAQAAVDVFRWCGELRGFGVRVKPSGVKTFLVQYRTCRGSTRRYSIGQYGRITVDQARKEAMIRLAEVARGGDPSQARRAARKIRTVAELCDSYLEDAWAGRVLHRGRAKKSSTLQIDQGRISRHIKPLLGKKPIDEVTRRDVERFLHDVMEGATRGDVRTRPRGRARVRGGPGTAAKAVNLLSAIFSYARRKQLIDTNPCTGVEKPADKRRQQYLTPDEYGKLGAAMRQAEELGFTRYWPLSEPWRSRDAAKARFSSLDLRTLMLPEDACGSETARADHRCDHAVRLLSTFFPKCLGMTGYGYLQPVVAMGH